MYTLILDNAEMELISLTVQASLQALLNIRRSGEHRDKEKEINEMIAAHTDLLAAIESAYESPSE